MNFLWHRYSRSGYAPPFFYLLMAAGFIALAVWAAIRHDWLIAAIAIAMLPVTIGGSRIMRRLSAASAASRRAQDAGKDPNDG